MRDFLKGFAPQIIALVGGFLLWFFVTIEQTFETTVRVPIRLSDVPENLTPANPFPEAAQVALKGKGHQLLLLKFTQPELLVNSSGAIRGMSVFKLAGKNVRLGSDLDVQVLFVKSPLEIGVEFDAIVKKEVPVEADLSVQLADNQTLDGEPVLLPATATVAGPRVNVAKIETLFTPPIRVERLGDDTDFYAFLKRPDLFGVEVAPNKIRISIAVEPVKKRIIEGLPIRLIDVPDGDSAELNTATVSLVIAGPAKDVDLVKKEYINVFVRYSRFSQEQLDEVEPTVTILGNVQWSNLQPPTVRLKKR